MVSRFISIIISSVLYSFITESESEVSQSCPTLCDPMDCSLPGSSIHGIFQARVLEWADTSFSRGSSQLRGGIWVSCVTDRCITLWVTKEAVPLLLPCNNSLYSYEIYYLTILKLMDIWVLSSILLLWICWCEHLYANFPVRMFSSHLGINLHVRLLCYVASSVFEHLRNFCTLHQNNWTFHVLIIICTSALYKYLFSSFDNCNFLN